MFMLLRVMPSILLKRMSKNKVKPIPQRYSWRHNEIPTAPVYKQEREEVDDEWDVEAICKKYYQKKEDDVES